jgi:hypothetical protein
VISSSPLVNEKPQAPSPFGHGARATRATSPILLSNRLSDATDGPALAENGQPKINGVGNNLAKDGPINGSGNNLPTDGPQNGDGNNKATDGPQKSFLEELATKWKKFSEKNILPYSTYISVAFNLISAPIRLFGRENPIAKLLNKLSIVFTKLHQLGYAATGIGMAACKKNLFYVLSFGLEALVALLPLRSIYLFKGMASALDILPSCVEQYTKDRFNNFSESIPKILGAVWQAIKDFTKNPKKYFENKTALLEFVNTQVPIAGAALSILGNIIGFSGKDTLGGGIRDIGAILNDCGLLFKPNRTAVTSGKYYAGGSLIDLAANGIGKFGQSKGSSNGMFGNIRDALHEIALASDRIGQKYFIHYNTQKDHEHDSKNVT